MKHSSRWFPPDGVSKTINVYWTGRPNEGTGTYVSFNSLGITDMPNMALVYSSADVGVSVDMIIEGIIQYALNSPLFCAWYSPSVGTPEEALRRAFEGLTLPMNPPTQYWIIKVDGQFGSVYVA